MVAKVFGLATGALVASLGVWGFSALRHVSDDDRLTSALAEQCIPYVQTGETPFVGMGRGVGVYDAVELDERVRDGGAAIIFDGRFAATWGELDDPALRLCQIDGRPNGAGVQMFAVAPDGFFARYSDIFQPLGDLQPDADRLGESDLEYSAFHTVAWFEADRSEDRGNRVVMSIVDDHVASVIVIRDLAD